LVEESEGKEGEKGAQIGEGSGQREEGRKLERGRRGMGRVESSRIRG
jgi:hypothetical protein